MLDACYPETPGITWHSASGSGTVPAMGSEGRQRVLLVAAVLAGCAGQRSPPPAVQPAPPAAAAGVPSTPRATGAEAAAMPLAEYRAAFVRELARLTRSRGAGDPRPGDPKARPPHEIAVLKRIGQPGAYLLATVGFGRAAPAKRGGARVELIAYVERVGPNLERTLSNLGETMAARGPDAAPWKEYDLVQLPAPQFGLQFFDLRPGGQVDVAPEVTVTLLKVVPISAEEYELRQKNPGGEYDDPDENTRAMERWRHVLER